jgi:hypothetical protein
MRLMQNPESEENESDRDEAAKAPAKPKDTPQDSATESAPGTPAESKPSPPKPGASSPPDPGR